MSKSLGNTVVPQDIIKQSGADILRLWVMTTNYWDSGWKRAPNEHRRVP